MGGMQFDGRYASRMHRTSSSVDLHTESTISKSDEHGPCSVRSPPYDMQKQRAAMNDTITSSKEVLGMQLDSAISNSWNYKIKKWYQVEN